MNRPANSCLILLILALQSLSIVCLTEEDVNSCKNRLVGVTKNIYFENCEAGREYPVKVEKVFLGNALFNKKEVKSAFFVGQPVEICMVGTVTEKWNQLQPTFKLKNSVHGDVQLVGDLVKVKYPFCDIDIPACGGFVSPTCDQNPATVQVGSPFCFCSLLQNVPTSPDVNADVYWKILQHNGQFEAGTCEKEFELGELAKKSIEPLTCVKIPAKVKNNPPVVFVSRKAQILAAAAGNRQN